MRKTSHFDEGRAGHVPAKARGDEVGKTHGQDQMPCLCWAKLLTVDQISLMIVVDVNLIRLSSISMSFPVIS